MNDEIDAGAAYLASLKRSPVSQNSSAAAAPARESAAQPVFAGGVAHATNTHRLPFDKRKSPRYKCEGSARVQEIGKSVSTWAKFSDISLHGCYVETASPLPVHAALNLRLEAAGFRIEASGEVRVAYPGLGMGVSFSSMPEEDRERLRELIRSLAPPSVILAPRVQTAAPPAPPVRPSEKLPALAHAESVLQALTKFFENRHVMGREEFLRILRMNA